MSFATRRTRDVAERQAAVELRRRVFCEEQGVSPADELDGRDGAAVHLVAMEGGEVIGTCRLLLRGTICQLSRMAVDAGARGRGVGGALLRAAEAEARAADAQHIALPDFRSWWARGMAGIPHGCWRPGTLCSLCVCAHAVRAGWGGRGGAQAGLSAVMRGGGWTPVAA